MRQDMKVAIITTLRHNIGDDFVRDGIVHLLQQVVGTINPRFIHKHFAVTVRREWDWVHRWGLTRMMSRVPRLTPERCSRWLDALPLFPITDKILSAELLVQSGAPVYWLNAVSDCSRNEWYAPLIKRRWQRVRDRMPLLNIAAGACQTYDSNGDEFRAAAETLRYIRQFHDQCALTTVRDTLSVKILELAGVTAPLLACPSLFARRLHGIAPETPRYIVLNCMRLGGHYELESEGSPRSWLDTFVAFARRVARTERCLLVCHNREEMALAERLLPDIERFYSSRYSDYLPVFARASCGVVNRVHAAFAIASFGRPSLVIGNDSRARMTEMIGLPNIHVGAATLERLDSEFITMRTAEPATAARLDALCERTEEAYLKLIRGALRR
jgi:hypothetical protein